MPNNTQEEITELKHQLSATKSRMCTLEIGYAELHAAGQDVFARLQQCTLALSCVTVDALPHCSTQNPDAIRALLEYMRSTAIEPNAKASIEAIINHGWYTNRKEPK